MRRVHAFLLVALVGLAVAGVTSAARIHELHPPGWHRTADDEIAFSPNGRWLAGVGIENPYHGVYVRSVNQDTGELVRVGNKGFASRSDPQAFAFSPDSRLMAICGNNGVEMLSMNPATGVLQRASRYPDPSCSAGIAFSPSGKLVAIANEENVAMLTVDPGTGKLRYAARWLPPGGGIPEGGWNTVAFNPHGTLMAVATESLTSAGEQVNVLSVSPHGKLRRRATFSSGISTDAGSSVAFSPNGRFLVFSIATDENGGVTFMLRVDHRTGKLRRIPGRPFRTTADPNQVAFSPSGKLLAMANTGPRMIVLAVNRRTGHLRPLHGSPFGAGLTRTGNTVAFSPNGHLLAFGTSTELGLGDKIVMFSIRR